jgi:hypothetical protein
MNRKKADLPGLFARLVRPTGRMALCGVLAVVLLPGCAADEGPQTPQAGPTTDVFGRQLKDGKPVETAQAGSGAWSIVLGAFSRDREADLGQAYEAAAHTALFRAQALAGLDGVLLEKRGTGLVLLYGAFESPTSVDAQRELAYVRSIEVGGRFPYEGAFLSPPGATSGSMPDYDLATVRARRNTKAPLYTLQVAVYGRPDNSQATAEDLTQFRKSAEEAVGSLRSEGEQAYYYHGPNRSMVTVGVYSEQDAGFGGRFRGEGAALVLARQKFPNNLLNGEAVRERLPGRGGSNASDFRLQPSRLVEIPE